MSQEDRQRGSEQAPRPYGCPCGKDYLSYPALYTHVRTKHEGKAPGELITPKTEKTRGRPRNIIVDAPLEDEEGEFDLTAEVGAAVGQSQVEDTVEYDRSFGGNSCQDMGTSFLEELKDIEDSKLEVVECFLEELRIFLNKKGGQNFWTEEGPGQIIDHVNQFYHSKTSFPLDKRVLMKLTQVLFRWMHRNSWTPHRLALRPANSQAQEPQQPQ